MTGIEEVVLTKREGARDISPDPIQLIEGWGGLGIKETLI